MEETELETPYTDGTRYRHRMQRILKKTPAARDYSFTLRIEPRRSYRKIPEAEDQLLKPLTDSS